MKKRKVKAKKRIVKKKRIVRPIVRPLFNSQIDREKVMARRDRTMFRRIVFTTALKEFIGKSSVNIAIAQAIEVSTLADEKFEEEFTWS
jgi:hypothetical protein